MLVKWVVKTSLDQKKKGMVDRDFSIFVTNDYPISLKLLRYGELVYLIVEFQGVRKPFYRFVDFFKKTSK